MTTGSSLRALIAILRILLFKVLSCASTTEGSRLFHKTGGPRASGVWSGPGPQLWPEDSERDVHVAVLTVADVLS